jgi:hypothetical protein
VPIIVREDSPGVWIIDFPLREDVVAARCGPALPPLTEASRAGPLILIAQLPADVRFIEPAMSLFWLEAMTQGGLRVTGIGVVTKSMAVRTVVSAFGMAMKLRERPILARTFLTPPEAVEWARTVAVPRTAIVAAAVKRPPATNGP